MANTIEIGGSIYEEATVKRHLIMESNGTLRPDVPADYSFESLVPFRRAHYPGGRMRAPGIVDPTMRIVLGLLP